MLIFHGNLGNKVSFSVDRKGIQMKIKDILLIGLFVVWFTPLCILFTLGLIDTIQTRIVYMR